MLDLSQLENLVSNLVEIRKTINKF
jgi:hypothetical protein